MAGHASIHNPCDYRYNSPGYADIRKALTTNRAGEGALYAAKKVLVLDIDGVVINPINAFTHRYKRCMNDRFATRNICGLTQSQFINNWNIKSYDDGEPYDRSKPISEWAETKPFIDDVLFKSLASSIYKRETAKFDSYHPSDDKVINDLSRLIARLEPYLTKVDTVIFLTARIEDVRDQAHVDDFNQLRVKLQTIVNDLRSAVNRDPIASFLITKGLAHVKTVEYKTSTVKALKELYSLDVLAAVDDHKGVISAYNGYGINGIYFCDGEYKRAHERLNKLERSYVPILTKYASHFLEKWLNSTKHEPEYVMMKDFDVEGLLAKNLLT